MILYKIKYWIFWPCSFIFKRKIIHIWITQNQVANNILSLNNIKLLYSTLMSKNVIIITHYHVRYGRTYIPHLINSCAYNKHNWNKISGANKHWYWTCNNASSTNISCIRYSHQQEVPFRLFLGVQGILINKNKNDNIHKNKVQQIRWSDEYWK